MSYPHRLSLTMKSLEETFNEHRIESRILGTRNPTMVSARVPKALRGVVQREALKVGASESEFIRFCIADTLARHDRLGVIR